MNSTKMETKREKAIRAFGIPYVITVWAPSKYTIYSSLQWKDFTIKKGSPLRMLPTATVTRSYWFHRLWNKVKAMFSKPTKPVSPAEAYYNRSHNYVSK